MFLPKPLPPVLVGYFGIAGICLIRLAGVRPAGVPTVLGITSENAAHRVAVEWDTIDRPVTGAYIPRRDTSSPLGSVLGGRVFPGWQHRVRFQVEERDGSYPVEVSSHDGEVRIPVAAHRAKAVLAGSVFGSAEQHREFFPVRAAGLRRHAYGGCLRWRRPHGRGLGIEPLHLDEVRSSFFDSSDHFAAGTAMPDSAFVMGGPETCWRPQPALLASQERGHIPARVGQPPSP